MSDHPQRFDTPTTGKGPTAPIRLHNGLGEALLLPGLVGFVPYSGGDPRLRLLLAPLHERVVRPVERQLVHPLVPLPVRPRRALQQQAPAPSTAPATARRTSRARPPPTPPGPQVVRDRRRQPPPRLGLARQLLGVGLGVLRLAPAGRLEDDADVDRAAGVAPQGGVGEEGLEAVPRRRRLGRAVEVVRGDELALEPDRLQAVGRPPAAPLPASSRSARPRQRAISQRQPWPVRRRRATATSGSESSSLASARTSSSRASSQRFSAVRTCSVSAAVR